MAREREHTKRGGEEKRCTCLCGGGEEAQRAKKQLAHLMGATSGRGLRRGCCWWPLSTEGLLSLPWLYTTLCVGRGRGGGRRRRSRQRACRNCRSPGEGASVEMAQREEAEMGEGQAGGGEDKVVERSKLNSHLW